MPHFLTIVNWQVGNISSCSEAVAVIIASFVALRNLHEAARLRKEQIRPYISVELRLLFDPAPMCNLVIKNHGVRAARNIAFTTSNDLNAPVKTLDEIEVMNWSEKNLTDFAIFQKGIRTLVPNQEIEFLASIGHEYSPRLKAGKAPNSYVVNVEYDDEDGNSYSGEFGLDIDLLMDITRARAESDLSKIAKSLEKIAAKDICG
jgi:hypothetical protein